MLYSDWYKYLCERCSKYDQCVTRNSGTDLEFCSNYEIAKNLNIHSSPISINNNSELLIKNYGDNQLKGICRNCANLKDCLHPKPEGGLWRCEEYE